MARRIGQAGLPILFALALGCSAGSVKESQSKKLIANLNETADLLASVKDEASARSASARLKQLLQSDKDLQAAMRAPGNVSPEEMKAMQELVPQVEAAQARRLTELKRVSAMPGVRDILKSVLVPGSP